jgi:hypothetical protein
MTDQTVDALDFVGFQECFEDWLCRRPEILNWVPDPTVPLLNASRTVEAPIDPTFCRWLEDATRFDRALYDHALARWRP